jgi:anti-sigma regulatory factor (Ser/Thr protein kinase)
MNASFHRTIPNDLTALEGLMNDATSFLEAEQIEPAAVYRVNLALEEIVSNIIKYGYDAPGRHEIRLALQITGEEVRAVIEDDGHEFNPLVQTVKNASIPLQERPIGGLGLELVRKLLHRLEYRRENGRNILDLGTRRKSPAGSV